MNRGLPTRDHTIKENWLSFLSYFQLQIPPHIPPGLQAHLSTPCLGFVWLEFKEVGDYNGSIFSKHERAAEHMDSRQSWQHIPPGHHKASWYIFPDSSKDFAVVGKIYTQFIQNFKYKKLQNYNGRKDKARKQVHGQYHHTKVFKVWLAIIHPPHSQYLTNLQM